MLLFSESLFIPEYVGFERENCNLALPREISYVFRYQKNKKYTGQKKIIFLNGYKLFLNLLKRKRPPVISRSEKHLIQIKFHATNMKILWKRSRLQYSLSHHTSMSNIIVMNVQWSLFIKIILLCKRNFTDVKLKMNSILYILWNTNHMITTISRIIWCKYLHELPLTS